MTQGCLRCGDEFDDTDREYLAGYCSPHCRRSAGTMATMDAQVDWFAIRLRQSIVRDCWPDQERQQRARPEWKRQRAGTREIAEESVFAAVADDLTE